MVGRSRIVKKLLAIFLTVTMVLGGLVVMVPWASAHVPEHKGKALQLYSDYTKTAPTIDGNIMTSDPEWSQAYVRQMTLVQVGGVGTKGCTLLFMNNATTLFVALVYSDTTSNAGDYAFLYFDEGADRNAKSPVDGSHDDKLTKNNEDGMKLAPFSGTVTDYFWDGSAWSTDSLDGTAKGTYWGATYNYEFSIPLDVNVDGPTGSDLNVAPTDELGFFLEVYEAGQAKRYVIQETNGWNATQPQLPELGKGWTDLQLGHIADRTLGSQYTGLGLPSLTDGIPISGDKAWGAVTPKDMLLTDYNGHTIPASLYSMESGTNLYMGAKVYDTTNNANDRFTIYQDRGAAGGSRDWRLSNQNENAVSLDGADNYQDMTYDYPYYAPVAQYWGNSGGVWVHDTVDVSIAADNPYVQFRFYMHSDNFNTAQGWYIDDVTVMADGNNILTQNFDAWPGPFPTVNFQNGWSHNGAADDWQAGTPNGVGGTPNACHSNFVCLGTNIAGHAYSNNEDSYVYGPLLDLTGYKTVTVSYWHWYNFVNWAGNDHGELQVYTVGGSWVQDGIVGDGTDGQGNENYFDETGTSNDHYEFEFRVPTNGGAADLETVTGNVINILPEFYDAGTNSKYYWEETSNITTFVTETGPSVVSTVGWAQLQTGYPWLAITDPTASGTVAGYYVVKVSAWDNGGTQTVNLVSLSVDDGSWSDATPANQNEWHWIWNTTGLTEGAHLLKARAIDENAQVWITDNITVMVDNYKPTLQVMWPTQDTYLGGSSVTLSATALETNGNAATPIYSVDGGPWAAMSGNGPKFTANWDSTAVKDGNHTLTFATWDESFNVVISTVTIVVDNEKPTCSVSFPINDQYVAGTIDIKVLARDNLGMAKVDLAFDSGTPITLASPQGDYYGLTLDTTTLTNGKHTLLCSAKDRAANTYTGTPLEMLVDNAPPVLTITAPTGLYVENTTQLKVDVLEDYLDVIDYKIDNGPWNNFTSSTNGGTQYADGWDTKLQEDGLHTVTVMATDKIGHVSTISRSYVVDNHAPALQVTAPIDGQYMSGLFQVRAVASNEVGIQMVQVWLNTTNPTKFQMLETQGYTYQLDTSAFDDGNYTMSIQATDLAGHITKVMVPVHIDNIAPVMTVNTPVVDSYIEKIVTPDVTCTDMFLDKCLYNVDGGSWVPLGNIDTTVYADGPHTITFRALALSDAYTDTAVPVIIDNTPPKIIAQFPLAGDYLQGNEMFYVQVIEVVKVASVQFSVGGINTTGTYDPMDGLWKAYIDTSNLKDGSYVATLSVKDGIGHVTTVSPNVGVKNVLPVLKPQDPIEGSYMTGVQTLKVNNTDILEYSVDGSAWVSGTTPLDTTKLKDGPHLLSMRARDAAGHVVSMDLHVTIDNTAPVVSFVKPVAEQHVAGATPFELAIDEPYIATINVLVDSTAHLNVDMTAPFIGMMDTKNFTDGKHTLAATVTDLAGHSTKATVEVVVDNSAPAVVSTVPEGKTVQGNVKFKLTVTDATSIDGVMIRVDQGAWQEAVLNTDGTYSYTWKTGVPENGQHTYAVKTWDSLGNTQTTVFGFKVVNADYTWLLVVIVLVLIVAAIGLLLWRRKKAGTEEDLGVEEGTSAADKDWAKDADEDEAQDTKVDEKTEVEDLDPKDAKSLKDKKGESEMKAGENEARKE